MKKEKGLPVQQETERKHGKLTGWIIAHKVATIVTVAVFALVAVAGGIAATFWAGKTTVPLTNEIQTVTETATTPAVNSGSGVTEGHAAATSTTTETKATGSATATETEQAGIAATSSESASASTTAESPTQKSPSAQNTQPEQASTKAPEKSTQSHSKSTTKATAAPTKPPVQTTTTLSPEEELRRQSVEAAKRINPEDVAKAMLAAINRYRAAEGARPLIMDPLLTQVAKYRSKQIVTNFRHDPDDMTEAYHAFGLNPVAIYKDGLGRESTGEAICTSFGFTAAEVGQNAAQGLHDSPGHWRYIGNDAYEIVGIACTYSESDDTWYCCTA